MKTMMAALAVAAATLVAPAAANAQVAEAPDAQAGAGHLVRDPSGQLVRAVPGPAGPDGTAQSMAADKAPPPRGGTLGTGTGCTLWTNGQYYYCRAGAYQRVTSDGAQMSTPVHAPTVPAGDLHSLTELAVESADRNQIVEVGSRTYRPEGQSPKLFVFHWINGQGQCYNACGFVSTSTTITPGMTLPASATPSQFAIQYFQSNWWIGYNGTWFGYYPGSRWGGAFTRTGSVQMFGEVSSTALRPCADMGNGTRGTSATGAAVTGVTFYNATSSPNLVPGTMDDSTLYDSRITTTNSFRYGGPGNC